MNLTSLDWAIVAAVFVFIVASVMASKSLMRSVSDFLAAGRTGGRYLISLSQGTAALGAITIVGMLEMNFIAGFNLRWWEMVMTVVLVAISVSGWVLYRFRQTRCLTMAQFFEIRYSRNFRIFAGGLAFLSGIINFGIFPAVSARFFIYFCGLPATVDVFGLHVSTFALIMIVVIAVPLYFVLSGGQIAVMITDFLQGVFTNVVFIVIVVVLMLKVDWAHIFPALSHGPGRRLAGQPVPDGQHQGLQLLVLPHRHDRGHLRQAVLAGHPGLQRLGQERPRGQDGRRADELAQHPAVGPVPGLRARRRLHLPAPPRLRRGRGRGPGRPRRRRQRRPAQPADRAHRPEPSCCRSG